MALLPLAAGAQDYVPGEVIVKLKGKPKSIEAQAFIGKAVSEKSMSLKGSWAGLNMHHFGLKPGASVDAAIADLQADPNVQYAEPNYILRRFSNGVEGSAVSFGEVQAHANDGGGGGVVGKFAQTNAPIQLSEGWSAETPNLTPTVVAIIDTGMDVDHEVFQNSGALWTNSDEVANNGVDDDNNGYIDDMYGWNFVAGTNDPDDDDGHGTHVAGIILGVSQDITAVPIAAARIRLMPLKFLDANGSGSTSDAIKAIYYAVNNGAKVLNNSWGGGGYSNSLIEAIAYSYNNQVAFVAAAGNSSNNNDSNPTYPANYSVPHVISIAATSDIDGFASFSNYGAQTVHMASPGVSIWSTLPRNLYGRMSGTSMAAPFVSGVAALMMRESPTMNGYQVKTLIFSGAETVSSLTSKTVTRGRLNSYNAVVAAKSTSVDSSQPGFDLSSLRSTASADMGSTASCGLVVKALKEANDFDGPASPMQNVKFFALLIILLSPILLSIALRKRDGRTRRRHTRYHIDSSVRVRVGDRELVGSVSTISAGGVQLNADAWLENGGVVKMQISSPDGKEQIEVDGKIVWSEEQKRYGVAFANADQSIVSAINNWTKSLLKA